MFLFRVNQSVSIYQYYNIVFLQSQGAGSHCYMLDSITLCLKYLLLDAPRLRPSMPWAQLISLGLVSELIDGAGQAARVNQDESEKIRIHC